MIKIGLGRALVALGALIAAATPAVPQARERLPALAKLQPGLYQLRQVEGPRGATRSICLGSPDRLIQLEHRGAPCSQVVVGNTAGEATVHYTCPAGGYGRTSIRVETPRLAQIDTQGISGNRPFAYRAEARRVGACSRGR